MTVITGHAGPRFDHLISVKCYQTCYLLLAVTCLQGIISITSTRIIDKNRRGIFIFFISRTFIDLMSIGRCLEAKLPGQTPALNDTPVFELRMSCNGQNHVHGEFAALHVLLYH